MALLPKALNRLIEELGNLPGVGPRTAERYAYHLLKSDPHKAKRLAEALGNVHDSVTYCKVSFALIESSQEISPLYSDPSRNKRQIAIVEDPLDIIPLEKTNQYSGTYHVLGGLLSPIDGIGPEQLNIEPLMKRIDSDKVEEVILAMNGSIEGETTALYLQQRLPNNLRVTRLARGLPAGVDLEYADQLTLLQALEGRQTV